MNDDLIILDGCTFVYSDGSGDVEAEEAEGFFYQDVRHLSRWLLRIDGEALEPLTSRRVDYYSARIVGTQEDGDAPPIAVRRDRFVSEGMHEDIVIQNLRTEPCTFRLELSYASDFADVMEAEKGGVDSAGRQWTEVRKRSVALWEDREGYRRGTILTFNRLGTVGREKARFKVELGPRETWSLCIDVTPVVDGERRPPMLRCGAFHHPAPKVPIPLDKWLDTAPEIVTGERKRNASTGRACSTSRRFACGRTPSGSSGRCPAAASRGT
jgi:hypothetical protein